MNAGTKRVAIRREGQFLHVEPPSVDLLSRYLRTDSTKLRSSDSADIERGMRSMMHERVQNGWWNSSKWWGGLTRAVVIALNHSATPFDTFGCFHANLPLDANLLNAVQPADLSFIRFIAEHDRGVVRHGGSLASKAKLVAQAARMWPNLNVTVCTTAIDDTYQFADSLRAVGVPCTAFNHRHHPDVESRVAVCTYLYLVGNQIEPEKQNIVFCLDALKATAKSPSRCLSHLDHARLYAFDSGDRHLAPTEQDAIYNIFGFEQFDFAGHGLDRLPVKTLWLPAGIGPVRQQFENKLELKRKGIWHHATRNARVASAARMIDGLKCVNRLYVVTENLEHLTVLQQKLPLWPLWLGETPNLAGIDAVTRSEINRRRLDQWDKFPNRLLTTHAGMQRLPISFGPADVVIRADAGNAAIDINPGKLNVPTALDPHQPLIVVDFKDFFHPWLHQDARDRCRSNLQMGWPEAGSPPSTTRLYRFMTSRPQSSPKERCR